LSGGFNPNGKILNKLNLLDHRIILETFKRLEKKKMKNKIEHNGLELAEFWKELCENEKNNFIQVESFSSRNPLGMKKWTNIQKIILPSGETLISEYEEAFFNGETTGEFISIEFENEIWEGYIIR
jgi:hypothetical protein